MQDKKENRKLYKYPFIASEIFTADLEYLIKAFFEDEPSLDEEEPNKHSRKNSGNENWSVDRDHGVDDNEDNHHP